MPPSKREERLARLARPVARRDAAATVAQWRRSAQERWRLRALAIHAKLLRDWFPPQDACPALDKALAIGEAAARLLEGIGDTPTRERIDGRLLLATAEPRAPRTRSRRSGTPPSASARARRSTATTRRSPNCWPG